MKKLTISFRTRANHFGFLNSSSITFDFRMLEFFVYDEISIVKLMLTVVNLKDTYSFLYQPLYQRIKFITTIYENVALNLSLRKVYIKWNPITVS